VPEIGIGNKPIDGGHYLFTTDERDAFLTLEPGAAKFFRRWLGAEEFLNGFERWCLWLGEASPSELRALPECMKRVQAVKQVRLDSKSIPTRKLAENPRRFHVEFMPDKPFMVIPEVSSERRTYIPLGYLKRETLASNKLRLLPHAELWQFGILQSVMHMAWMRATCGRLESRYQYSINIVYNNFPWPKLPKPPATADATHPTPAQAASQKKRAAIEAAAQAVLDARASFPESSLADLYDPPGHAARPEQSPPTTRQSRRRRLPLQRPTRRRQPRGVFVWFG
jgi:hypothetical protein